MTDECNLLKKGYERYRKGLKREITDLNIKYSDIEHFLHVIFGAVKLGSEYYSKCDIENFDKGTILNAIGDSAVKLAGLKEIDNIQSKIDTALTTIKTQLESISEEDYKEKFEKQKKTILNKLKKLEE